MEPVSLKRPKPSDGEEELFRMQQEFHESNVKPAAKVINLRPANSLETNAKPTGRPRSKFSERKRLKGPVQGITTSQRGDEMVYPNAHQAKVHGDIVENPCSLDTDLSVSSSILLLGNIVERRFDIPPTFDSDDTVVSNISKTGFPEVFISGTHKPDSKHSQFSQQVSMQELTSTKSIKQNYESSLNRHNSVLVEGPWATEIHNANIQRLNQMDPEEIMSEKLKLQTMLDPALIEFIKTRKKKKLESIEVVNSSEVEMDTEPSDAKTEGEIPESAKCEIMAEPNKETYDGLLPTDIPEPSAEIIQQVEQKGWVHMDTIESDKLKWMEDVPVTTNNSSPEQPYNARFDFNGMLLPYVDESLTIDKGLHHHGEEPERPGYSLQELLQLSRSATQQQRCMALNTLANIMEKSRQGFYDQVLQPPLLPTLNEKNIFLLLRFSLDDSSVAVVTATLQALRSFLFSEPDELCLDRLVGLGEVKEPFLRAPPMNVTDEASLKDHEIAQYNLIAAAIRSDIQFRIRYILNEMRPPPTGVTAALEVLARIARSSHKAALEIACTPQLLETIVQYFIPLTTDRLVSDSTINDAYGVPVLAAIRLCRIFVTYGGELIAKRLYDLKILNSLLSYITGDSGKHGINLDIESFRLWKLLLVHGIGLESVGGAQLTLVSKLRNLLSNHDIGSTSELACEHAAALITVVQHEPSLTIHLATLLSKWSTQLASIPSPTWASTKLVAMTLMAVGDISLLKPLLDPQYIFSTQRNIFSTLCSSSNLLSGLTEVKTREPTSLPNLGVLSHEGRLLPAVSYNSCIPLLATVLTYLSKSLSKTEIFMIFKQPQLRKYIHKLEKVEWSLERSWYTRIELSLVTAIVKGRNLLGDALDGEMKETIWKLSIKLVSALPADAPLHVEEMLYTALAKDKFEMDTLGHDLYHMNFDNTPIHLGIDSESLEVLVRYYKRHIMHIRSWTTAALPKDWLYLPLVNLYAECKNQYSKKDVKPVKLILSLELIFPDLVAKLSPSLRYSRLLLIYLCDTLFLDNEISPLLTKVLTNLVENNYKNINLDSEIPGLSSFTDSFTALCEHFAATSYGDQGFGMALLVPLAQRHDVHYRRLLWSEHAAVLRSLRTPLKKLAIPLEEYLYPIEEDISLVECYLTALARGTVSENWSPVMYTVALHHVGMNLKETSKMCSKFKPRVEKLGNVELKNKLLNYIPPTF
ncbi:RNA polymerase II-associated protein 1 [Athalia rosae]|uniref:RNA polymerase II-associated protein 1 n=1 Tax=Athalia rosae TaxID=37344 RepID=UPI002033310A|nr:RNA polymerase II-associated protein 1 [Athalia rosae]